MKPDDEKRIPVAAKSVADMAKHVPYALAYLKRTNNLDAVEALGLSLYLEDKSDDQREKFR